MSKITNADFVKSIAKKTGFKQTDIKEVLTAVQNEVAYNLKNGDATKLFNWLTIEPVDKAARTARNPKTGETIEIPAKKAVKAKFGKGIKDLLNE